MRKVCGTFRAPAPSPPVLDLRVSAFPPEPDRRFDPGRMFTSAGESGIVRGTIRPIGPQRRIGEIFLGSWGRTLALSLLLLVLLAGVVWLAVSGRIANLSHTSFPGHSY